jgi:hypothetical protein
VSHSGSAERPSIKLSLIARPGISIRVLDAGLQEVDRGAGQLDTEQPEGLYLIEWSSAGQQSQTFARLDGKTDEVVLRFDPSDKSSAAELDSAHGDRIALVDAVSDALRPSERDYESSIALIVAGDGDVFPDTSDLQLRLLNREDIAMRARTSDSPGVSLGPQELARCYRIKPGRYHISFHSITGERLAQSVPALAGRKTLVFLTASRANLVGSHEGRFDKEVNVGLDPTRTIVVTVRGDEEDYRIRERVRIAGLLLYDIANGGSSLSQDIISVLDDEKTDPLLKLYGAAVALTCLERGFDPSPEVDRLIGERASPNLRDWGKRIREWAIEPGRPGLPPDALAAWWKLGRLGPSMVGSEETAALPSRIEVPPMLECSWRWAIEESIHQPDAVRGTALVAAAARSAGGTLPWLCWQVAAAKAHSSTVSRLTDDLASLMAEVAEKVGELVGPDQLSRNPAKDLEMLSPDAQATALLTYQLALPRRDWIDDGVIRDLALALGAPSRQLRRRLAKANEELDTVVAEPTIVDALESAAGQQTGLTEAPGLSLRIDNRNDPQKNRFGGKSRRDGFALSASFETLSKNWTQITLRVEGKARDGEEVQFHLHDSFKPPHKIRHFKNGIAKVKLTAWGGFTVGVWIPAHGVELEMDLAERPDAPRNIKIR